MPSAVSTDLPDADDFSDSHQPSGGSASLAIAESPVECESPGCPNCGAKSYSSKTWCKCCGFYAVMGRCIELEEWERETQDGENSDAKSDQTSQSTLFGIPMWAWQIGAVLVGVTGITVAGRCVTIEDSAPRITWSLGEVGCGLVAFVLAHVFIAKAAMAQNVSLQLGDALLSPVATWLEAFADFRRSCHWVVIGFGGIWGIVLAHVLLGVPYGRMFTHEETPPKKEAPGGGAANARGPSNKNMTMEEAMNEFAEKSGAKDMAGDAKKAGPLGQLETKDSKEDQPQIRAIDCLIVGYQPGTEPGSAITSVVVAIQSSSGWSVIGSVSAGLTPEIQQELGAKAASLIRAKPFVECNYQAVWLEPVLRCRIEATYPPGQEKPENLKFMSLQ